MNRIIEYSIVGFIIIAAGVGCYNWYSYERDRSSDFQKLVSAELMKNSLALYSQQYAAYPGTQDTFLANQGILAGSYQPLLLDATKCVETRCPSYSFTFALLTNAYLSHGEHTVTPSGIK